MKKVARALICDFGSGSLLQTCGWIVPPDSHPKLRWRTGQGAQAYWMGGPRNDHTLADTSGGYIYFETSHQPIASAGPALLSDTPNASNTSSFGSSKFSSGNALLRPLLNKFPVFHPMSSEPNSELPVPNSANFQGPNISDTGPNGLCLSFFYAIDGLSADNLQIHLRDVETGSDRTIWQSSEGMEGTWVRGEVAYTYGSVHKIVLKALSKKLDDSDRAYRGYIAVDDVQFQPIDEAEEQCKGHCTFEGGLCGWTNQEENDEFDWTLGRGSQNIFTGPSRDFTSFGQNEQSGGFVYIESSFPRRPGDRAMLVSPLMNPTDESNPLCMKFATHMYGNGIGVLRVRLRYTGDEERPEKIVWEIKGEAGNNWYLGQVPVSSPAQSFHVVIEGIIGQNSLGNIAIDNLSFQIGTCPISPQTASRGSGDCTFEENMCLWHNPLPHSRVDDFDWLRQYSFGGTGPKYDHTKKTPEGYFINLSGDALQPQRGGTRAWLLSPEFTPQTTTPKCLSFYYYMFERTIDPAGPSLGSLRVYIKTLSDSGEQLNLVWRLNNHQAQGWRPAKVPLTIGLEKKPPLQTYQILIEGIWGDGRVGTIAIDDVSFFDGNCAPQPTKAAAVMGECSFERDLCGYRNQSGTGPPEVAQFSPSPAKAALISNKRQSLNRLSVSSKESLTWKLATPTSRPANLQDHTFRAPNNAEGGAPPEEADKRGQNALTIETKNLLWRMSTRRFDTSRPEWIYGQLAINSEIPYRIQFEGEASDGGFALDDITFYDGLCQTRPLQAAVASNTQSDNLNVNEKSLREQ
ncbi:unnamed protein product [Medioppia subpectinata]|uniref:MAM domain-containing protein n=1 Tax=Medioppia subpectinata TaxID=1979941 RepID=A0A7R9Q135_9ACAR|nr:unnamed protein product [Medioppia subpectinata]CAG2108770.1 unnamed protein product [Medioppia subpectinata]